jgi:hypothetical protein
MVMEETDTQMDTSSTMSRIEEPQDNESSTKNGSQIYSKVHEERKPNLSFFDNPSCYACGANKKNYLNLQEQFKFLEDQYFKSVQDVITTSEQLLKVNKCCEDVMEDIEIMQKKYEDFFYC